MNSNAYNSADARRLARLSDIAYADREEAIAAAAMSLEADDVEFVETDETEVIVAKFGPDVFLAFRGTEPTTLRDLLTDAKIKLRSWNGIEGEVHSGFAESFSRVSLEVLEVIAHFLGDGGFVHVGGHSKGGAEALLFSAWFYGIGHSDKIAAIHVFGCPAVGDKVFAKWFNSTLGEKAFCHVHRSDFIARSPLILRTIGRYVFAGNVVYHLGGSKGRTFRPNPIRVFVDGVRAISRKRWLADHDIANYIRGTEQ